MKSQMSSFDIAAVVREMQQCVGMKADKFFLINHRELVARMSSRDSKMSVTVKLGRGIWYVSVYWNTKH